MVVKSRDAKERRVKGITFDLLAGGDRIMLTRMKLRAGDIIPAHSHPHEQAGYVVSGRLRLTCPAFDEMLLPGDSYSVPGGTQHGAKVIEDTIVIDVFAPPREEYR